MGRHTYLWMAILLLLLTNIAVSQQVNQAWIQNTLQSQVMATHNVLPERLQSSDVAKVTFPNLGIVIYTAKFVDTQTGATYQAATDVTGKAADVDALAAQEEKVKVAKYGKIDPQLFSLMEKMESGAVLNKFYTQATLGGTIPVAIWLAIPAMPLVERPASPDAATAQSNLEQHLRNVQTLVAPLRKGVVKALARMGVTAQEPVYAPAVFANLTPGQIRSIAKNVDVAVVYGTVDRRVYEDHASTTQRGYRIWAVGNSGAGMVRPVVHEPDGVSDLNRYLNNNTHPVIFYCSAVNTMNCPQGKYLEVFGYHATEVAGVIAATHPLYRGVSPSVQTVFSANSQTWNDADLVNAFEWAHANGGNPTNMSWGTTCPTGQQDFMSRYVDWATSNLWATFTVSAGNTGGTSCPYVASPGMAWNVITVGSQYDNYDGWWGGDGVSSFSSYVNPATGQEKPEVIAVGESVNTTYNTGLTTGPVAGTSFSAPQVAGQVALMLARQSYLQIWPEINRAMVMTSAFHDLGATRDVEGVGSVVMNNSDDSARLGRWGYITFTPTMTDWSATFYGGPLNLTQGHKYRIGIGWDSWSDGSTSDQLGADLDLYVYKPDGTLMAASASVPNAWEMVDFTAPVTGTYSANVHKFSAVSGWPGSYVGIAYSDRTIPNVCTGAGAGVGSFKIDTTNGPDYFTSYTGWSYGQTGREYMRKIVVPATGNHTIAVTNSNANMDLHLIQIPNCTADPPSVTVLANGNTSLQKAVTAGTYYVVVDGRDDANGIGYVGTATVGISLIAP